jgi:UDP-2-acetamido-3-amino-2,3-dideoxy-glucuronate N-acetyltransferase
MNGPHVHRLADVLSSRIGAGTRIWQFCVILPGARIGENCNICSHCFIENDVVIGNRVTVKNGVSIWDGLEIQDDVFIGPGVVFTNDRYPRSGDHSKPLLRTVVEASASLGGGCVILPGVRIGHGATIGAGAVVVRDVAPGTTMVGNPARPIVR